MANETISVWILGTQLLAEHPALRAAEDAVGRAQMRVLLVESETRARRRPVQRKKLVLLWSAMRHYAARLRATGYRVDYVAAPTFSAALRQHAATYHPTRLLTMAAADYPGRCFQQQTLPALLDVPVTVLPGDQFLVDRYNPLPDPEPGRQYVMEYFYRDMRRHFGVLVDAAGEPEGGRWNYDDLNREPLPPDLALPDPPAYRPDDTTRAVMEKVAALPTAIGGVDGFALAVTHEEAGMALADFVQQRLRSFGPYEDAMTARHTTLFHSILSPYVNLGLLTPWQMLQAALDAYARGDLPLNSVEGLVRQVMGWREFIYWQYWRQMPALVEANAWNATRPLPAFFWDGATEMNCLHHVIRRALDSGYTHHIERLMIICNYSLLAGFTPQAVLGWFQACYVDAYDWVMLPNVLGMGLNADGGLTATKPYIASANYINKMSDYCSGCRYDHRARTGDDACPFNALYWNFHLEHEVRLRANPRLGRSVYNLRHFDDATRAAIRARAQAHLEGE